jgi:hypothetical protein
MFINDPIGIVHRIGSDGTTCARATRNLKRKTVTAEQCFVYKLPPCDRCWRSVWTYYHATGVR